MRRWVMVSGLTGVALLVVAVVATSAFAGPTFMVGEGRAAAAQTLAPIGGEPAPAVPSSFQELTQAFTSTAGSTLMSRSTFSTTEVIQFNATLFETGLTGTSASVELLIFNTSGKLLATFTASFGATTADRTTYGITLAAGTFAPGTFTWLLALFDAFGNAFVTPFQTLRVQS